MSIEKFDNQTISRLIDHLQGVVTEDRFATFEENIQNRTKYMTVVLEDLYQPHNASAVLRSCDCFGVQDVHIIENKNEYTLNPFVTRGSSKWLSLKKYNEQENNTAQAINELKSQGYRIVATSPHAKGVNLEDFDVTQGKFALMFGSEMPGLTDLALDMADEYVKIPMFGFTESFNISVSAAISLHTLTHKIRNSQIPYKLTGEEKNQIKLDWLKKSVKAYDLIVKDFFEKKL